MEEVGVLPCRPRVLNSFSPHGSSSGAGGWKDGRIANNTGKLQE